MSDSIILLARIPQCDGDDYKEETRIWIETDDDTRWIVIADWSWRPDKGWALEHQSHYIISPVDLNTVIGALVKARDEFCIGANGDVS